MWLFDSLINFSDNIIKPEKYYFFEKVGAPRVKSIQKQ